MRYRFGGGGLIHGGAYFRNLTIFFAFYKSFYKSKYLTNHAELTTLKLNNSCSPHSTEFLQSVPNPFCLPKMAKRGIVNRKISENAAVSKFQNWPNLGLTFS